MVPHCYRRKMDVSFKNEYQLVILCQYCHDKYELRAEKIKYKLKDEYFSIMFPNMSPKTIRKASGLANNILNNNVSIEHKYKHLNYLSKIFSIPVENLTNDVLSCIKMITYDYSIILEIKHPQEIIDIFVDDFRKFLIYNASTEMRFV
jgi:hypothetical protein